VCGDVGTRYQGDEHHIADLLSLDDLSGWLRNRRKHRLNLLATNPILTLSRTTRTTSTAVAPREMPYEAEA
jgi:hypothetical protein